MAVKDTMIAWWIVAWASSQDFASRLMEAYFSHTICTVAAVVKYKCSVYVQRSSWWWSIYCFCASCMWPCVWLTFSVDRIRSMYKHGRHIFLSYLNEETPSSTYPYRCSWSVYAGVAQRLLSTAWQPGLGLNSTHVIDYNKASLLNSVG